MIAKGSLYLAVLSTLFVGGSASAQQNAYCLLNSGNGVMSSSYRGMFGSTAYDLWPNLIPKDQPRPRRVSSGALVLQSSFLPAPRPIGFVSNMYPSQRYDPQFVAFQNESYRLQREIDELRRDEEAGAANPAPESDGQAQVHEDRSRNALNAGKRLFAGGAYSRAAERFRDAARLNPTEAGPSFHLAQALFALKKYDQALAVVREGLNRNAKLLDADFNPRLLYRDPADYDRQVADLAAKIKSNGFDRTATLLMGYQLASTGDGDAARPLIEKAGMLGRKDPSAAALLGVLDRRAGVAPEEPADEELAVDPSGFGSDRRARAVRQAR
ncbi:MAG: tetratricopeptide repeat protein [Planctomycetia bacterium]